MNKQYLEGEQFERMAVRSAFSCKEFARACFQLSFVSSRIVSINNIYMMIIENQEMYPERYVPHRVLVKEWCKEFAKEIS